MRIAKASGGLLAIALIAAACGGSGTGAVEIVDSWAPSTPPNAPAAALYLTITNGTGEDEHLVAVASDRCAAIELHDTTVDARQIMRMRQATPEALTIPAGGSLEMVPGGLHVMCIDPTSPLDEGEEIPLQVTLETTGTVEIMAPVENR